MSKWLSNLYKPILSVPTLILLWSCEGKLELKTSPIDDQKIDCKESCPKILKVMPLALK